MGSSTEKRGRSREQTVKELSRRLQNVEQGDEPPPENELSAAVTRVATIEEFEQAIVNGVTNIEVVMHLDFTTARVKNVLEVQQPNNLNIRVCNRYHDSAPGYLAWMAKRRGAWLGRNLLNATRKGLSFTVSKGSRCTRQMPFADEHVWICLFLTVCKESKSMEG
jgi:hypothetical protein